MIPSNPWTSSTFLSRNRSTLDRSIDPCQPTRTDFVKDWEPWACISERTTKVDPPVVALSCSDQRIASQDNGQREQTLSKIENLECVCHQGLQKLIHQFSPSPVLVNESRHNLIDRPFISARHCGDPKTDPNPPPQSDPRTSSSWSYNVAKPRNENW
jgi:hypothetical protein